MTPRSVQIWSVAASSHYRRSPDSAQVPEQAAGPEGSCACRGAISLGLVKPWIGGNELDVADAAGVRVAGRRRVVRACDGAAVRERAARRPGLRPEPSAHSLRQPSAPDVRARLRRARCARRARRARHSAVRPALTIPARAGA
jgi:hypothetical protein